MFPDGLLGMIRKVTARKDTSAPVINADGRTVA
jgi:urea transport system permease protein